MTTNANNKTTAQAQFSLKHRLIGAGILISFGVLVLPWLLGSYSTEKKVTKSEPEQQVQPSSIATMATKAATKTINNDKESSDEDAKEIKKFISRVQPLQQKGKTSKAVKQEKDSKKQASKTKNDDKKIAEKTTQKPSVKDTQKKAEPKKATPKKSASKKAAPKKVVPAKDNQDIERGYIVSVGVFGDAKNVEKMVSDLKSKSFKPSVRKEKFNDKNVNRIYMGPFKTRAEAGKIKLKLSENQNIPSLIKEFP